MGLSRQQKIERTEALAARLRDIRALYFADFTGLNVQALTQLRRQLGAAGAELVVVKNTLARRAVQGLDFPEIAQLLNGPTALVLGTQDPLAPARILRAFAQENAKRPTVRAGVVNRQLLSGEQVETLASLPSRDVLLGSIAGALTAGVAGIAGVLEAVLRDLALLIEEVARTQGAAPQTAEPPAEPQAAEPETAEPPAAEAAETASVPEGVEEPEGASDGADTDDSADPSGA